MADSRDSADGGLLGWAVVANVVREARHGPGGEVTTQGLRHFAPGTKVWVLPAQWGDGWHSAVLVGRHRGSRRFAQMVVPLWHLENFRTQGVYSPAVMTQLKKPLDGQQGEPRQWRSEQEAQEAISKHPTTRGRLAHPIEGLEGPRPSGPRYGIRVGLAIVVVAGLLVVGSTWNRWVGVAMVLAVFVLPGPWYLWWSRKLGGDPRYVLRARPPDQRGLFWVGGRLVLMVAVWALLIVVVDSLGVMAAVGIGLVLFAIATARLIRSSR